MASRQEPPPPPVTVWVPSSGAARADLLEAGPAEPRRAGSRRERTVLLAALVVAAAVGAGVRAGAPGTSGAAARAPGADVPGPAGTAAPLGAPSITGSTQLGRPEERRRLVERLTVTVDLGTTPRGDRTPGGPQPLPVVLTDVRVRGFAVQVLDPPLPLVLNELGPGGTRPSTLALPADVAVVDCSVEPQAPRDVRLLVRSGGGPESTVRAAAGPEVVRALDRLVSRTCRRPRG